MRRERNWKIELDGKKKEPENRGGDRMRFGIVNKYTKPHSDSISYGGSSTL